MKQLDELSHLCRFIEENMENETGVISQEVVAELKIVIEAYALRSDFNRLDVDSSMSEDRRSEMELLRSRVKYLENVIQEQRDTKEGYKKSYTEITDAMMQMSTVHTNYTDDLVKKLMLAEETTVTVTTENERLKKNLAEYEVQINRLIEDKQTLIDNNHKFKDSYARAADQCDHLQKQLKDLAMLKEREDKKHERSLGILNAEGMKLRKQVEISKHTEKTNEFLIKSLRSENRELKTELTNHKEKLEKLELKDKELVDGLVKELAKLKCSNDDVNRIMSSIGKQYHIDRTSKNRSSNTSECKIKLNSSQYENLESYEDIFNNSVAVDATESFQEETANGVKEKETQINTILKKENKNMEDSFKDDLPDFKRPKSKNKIGQDSTNVLPFATTREELSRNLDSIIKKKLSFMSNRKSSNPKDFEFQGLAQPSNQATLPVEININSEITREVFVSLTESVDAYLKTDKNPTTFIFNEFEKSRMQQRFDKTDPKSIKVAVQAIIKIFIHQIDFLEGHLKNLTIKNSQLQLKVDDLKYDLNNLLSTYLEKNQKNQDFLNSNTKFFYKAKTSLKLSVEGSGVKKSSSSFSGQRLISGVKKQDTSGSLLKESSDKIEQKEEPKAASENDSIWAKFTSIIKFD